MPEARILYGGQGDSILYGGGSFLNGRGSWRPDLFSLQVVIFAFVPFANIFLCKGFKSFVYLVLILNDLYAVFVTKIGTIWGIQKSNSYKLEKEKFVI